MTAEVAVVNKSAIVLASDSAVTIELVDSNGRTNDKIYNTANKLFSLSKHAPVGIMLYNTMELGGVPWETIIKEYRRHLGDAKYDRLEGYAESFWNYLCGNEVLFGDDQVLDVLLKIIARYFSSMKQEVMTRESAKAEFETRIAELEKMNFAESFTEADMELTAPLTEVIGLAAKGVLDENAIEGLEDLYTKLAMLAITKERQLSGYTGVVFAGFGEQDVFPRLVEFHADLILARKVRKKEVTTYSPGQFKAGKVLSFAQQDITQTILTGINPSYAEQVRSDAIEFLAALPRKIIDGIDELSDELKASYKEKALKASIESMKDFFARMEREREERHTFPIEKAIQMMPFIELAEIAELFIRLTQVRRRLSPDSETVGGPIDVAVISKADGFVWIKRKFYFDKELNYAFLKNY